MNEGSLSAAAVGPRALGRALVVGDASRMWGPKHCSRVKGGFGFSSRFGFLADTVVVEIRRLGFADGDEREETGDKMGKDIQFLLVVSTVQV